MNNYDDSYINNNNVEVLIINTNPHTWEYSHVYYVAICHMQSYWILILCKINTIIQFIK